MRLIRDPVSLSINKYLLLNVHLPTYDSAYDNAYESTYEGT